MKVFGKLARTLFKAASVANDINIYSSGNPQRIVRHVLRKSAYKKLSKIGRVK